jgi:hypothetical protein
MKSHWMLVGLAAVGLGFAFVANSKEVDPFADPPAGVAPPVPMQVQVQVEFVELSHEALTKLLFLTKPTSADATALRQQLQDMVSKNEAKILETQIAVARSGQKGGSESIHEFIYPTEYEPTCSLMDEELSKKPKTPNALAVPTTFETRNLGSILEVEPAVGEGNRIVELRFVPELIWHSGSAIWYEGKDSSGNPFKVQTPDIYTIRLNTGIQCISGQYTLAGVISPKNDKGDTDMTRKVMVFVKCDVLEVK